MTHELYAAYKSSSGVCTDSRLLKSGNLFFALKGPSFNGNDFVLDVLDQGASYAVADENRLEFIDNPRILICDDALTSLQDLARFHRGKLKIPIIGLTGSNGKTTSKELLFAALSEEYVTYATKGNLNNHIGVPLSLLEINSSHEIGIIEMGANHQKEIELLCSIARPDHGLITNIGLAHLEGFGGEEGIFKGKKELFDYLIHSDGRLFINADDAKVVHAAGNKLGVLYGNSDTSNYQGSPFLKDGFLSVQWWINPTSEKHIIQSNLSGLYNFSNIMAAIAVASYFGVTPDKIKKGISNYIPTNNRSQITRTKKSNTVIVDCYNANPSSMVAAIANLESNDATNKLAIVGDMYELGTHANEKHKEVLMKLSDAQIKTIAVGDTFKLLEPFFPSITFLASTDLALDYISKEQPNEHLILLKGSRKMKLERLLELL
jgi:UDP-N-acetylmuramoyl-tripeptide--D-alanyl-D-alanine ligase